jgi:CreA protein
VNTAITNLGLTRSHRVVVERFDDPEVRGISCYISQATHRRRLRACSAWRRTPARFALTCTATGPVEVLPGARRGDRGEQGLREARQAASSRDPRAPLLDEERRGWSTSPGRRGWWTAAVNERCGGGPMR